MPFCIVLPLLLVCLTRRSMRSESVALFTRGVSRHRLMTLPLRSTISAMTASTSALPLQLTVGVLALQGGFHEHADLLRTAGRNLGSVLELRVVFVRTARELEGCDALIIPGGESTTIILLATNNGLVAPLRDFIAKKPVWGTCAGMILLSEGIYRESGDTKPKQEGLGGVDLCVVRNQYGRQVS